MTTTWRKSIGLTGTPGARPSRVDGPPDLIKRSGSFAAEAFAFYQGFPFPSKGCHAAEQFYRAASSAASNYRAAKRGRSPDEFIGKLGLVVEEIDEAVGWLEHMRDIGLEIDSDLLSEAEQLRRIFGASLGTARRNLKARKERLRAEAAQRRQRRYHGQGKNPEHS